MTLDPVIAAALRVLLALLFAAAATHKLTDLASFRIVLHDYRVLPRVFVSAATAMVVVAEIGLAAALPWPGVSASAAWLAVTLLALYSAGIAVNLLRGRRTLECGCAPSTYRQPLSGWLLARNGVLIVAAVSLTFPTGPRSLAWLDAVTFVGTIVAGAAAWIAAQRLLALEPRSVLLRGVA